MNFASKSERLKRLITECSIDCFIETGTYQGRMVDAIAPIVLRVLTCELDKTLASAAIQRFSSDPKVTVLQGDSGELLDGMLRTANSEGYTSVVWLDAHYSGGITAMGPDDSPVARELIIVERWKPKVVVIDDRRCMGNRPGWPTENEVIARMTTTGYNCYVEGDSVIAKLDS